MKNLIQPSKRFPEVFSVSLCALICVALFIFPSKPLFLGYLIAFLFWLGISIGSLSLLFVWILTGGAWGKFVHLNLERAASAIPSLAICALPIYVHSNLAYPWRHGDSPNAYLEFKFFLLRGCAYFAIWIWLQKSYTARAAKDVSRAGFAALGALLMLVTTTFSAIDWVMSLTPDWSSTAFGLFFLLGNAVSALSLAALLKVRAGVAAAETSARWDVSKVLFATTLLLLYLYYSQYVIFWMGNLPHEVKWYINRLQPHWKFVSAVLLGLFIVVPEILLLLSGWFPVTLTLGAGLLFSLRLLDLIWLTIPGQRFAALSIVIAAGSALVLSLVWSSAYRRCDANAGRLS